MLLTGEGGGRERKDNIFSTSFFSLLENGRQFFCRNPPPPACTCSLHRGWRTARTEWRMGSRRVWVSGANLVSTQCPTGPVRPCSINREPTPFKRPDFLQQRGTGRDEAKLQSS
ncbi:hypothetical protein XELAEV_18047432mg [Xenopus laevis]|uniref:Uncharacterized protein n=1 Tax=Xenopus laevis TaxID=8355 RepID=A0A974BUW8_XENLA|nr:hypothetical protein XELAEV_18047432mg [Xenopus laevis]